MRRCGLVIIKNLYIDAHGNFEMIRGDTVQFELEVFSQGLKIEQYNATFSVKQYLDDDNYLFQVMFDQSTPCIIGHSTTQDLPYGSYWWDVQITYQEDGATQYKTVGAFPFMLKPDVTGR
jgi:hypothetical protein